MHAPAVSTELIILQWVRTASISFTFFAKLELQYFECFTYLFIMRSYPAGLGDPDALLIELSTRVPDTSDGCGGMRLFLTANLQNSHEYSSF